MADPKDIAAEQDRIARIVGIVAVVVGVASLAAAAGMVLLSDAISLRAMLCFGIIGFAGTGWGLSRLMRGADHE